MSKSKAKVRTESESAKDLITIQQKLKEGYSWRRIGNYINSEREYNLGHEVYFRQYKNFVNSMTEETKVLREEYIEMQLTEIAELKTEVWNSWLISKGMQKIDTIKNVSDEEIETVTKEWNDAGGINYLNAYIKLLERESKLLGLDAAEKKEITGADGKDLIPERENLTAEQLAEINKILLTDAK